MSDIFSLSHIFTGVGSDMNRIKQVVKSASEVRDEVLKNVGVRRGKNRRPKPPLEQWRHNVSQWDKPGTPKGGPSLAVPIGRMRDEEDDRWAQVEGGSPCRWRSCRACSFLGRADEPACEACGLSAVHGDLLDDPTTDEESTMSRMSSSKSLREVLIAHYPSDSEKATDRVARRCVDDVILRKPTTLPPANEATSSSTPFVPSFDENENIAGTLDEAPPVGTEVQVLYDDDRWHLGVVIKRDGSKITVRYRTKQNGKQEESTVNVDVDAVRLGSYVDEPVDQGKRAQDAAEGAAEESGGEDEAEDGDPIEGTLDEPPPVGSRVQVLYDNSKWYPATIIAVEDSIGTVRYDKTQTEETLDFNEFAVRPIDYVPEECGEGKMSEHESEDDKAELAEDLKESIPSLPEDGDGYPR